MSLTFKDLLLVLEYNTRVIDIDSDLLDSDTAVFDDDGADPNLLLDDTSFGEVTRLLVTLWNKLVRFVFAGEVMEDIRDRL